MINMIKFFLFNSLGYDFHTKHLISGASTALVIRLLAFFSTYVFTFIIARFYGASVLGVFSLSQTVLFFTSLFVLLGLDTTLIKYVSRYHSASDVNNFRHVYFLALKIVFITSFFISSLVFLFSSFIANEILNKPNMESSLEIISLSILPFSLLSLHAESFRGVKNILLYSIIKKMSIPFLSAIVLLIFYLIGYNTALYPLYSYVSTIFVLCIAVVVLWNLRLPLEQKEFKEKSLSFRDIMKTSLPMFFTTSMSPILSWSAVLILGVFVDSIQIGIYSLAMKLSMFTSLGLFAINSIAAPKFAELYKKDICEFRNIVRKSSKMIFWLTGPILITLFLFSNFFLSIFGEDYLLGKNVLFLLVIGQFISSLTGSVGYILQMTGKEKIMRNVLIATTLLGIFLHFILIPKYGMIGAAFSICLCVSIRNLICAYYVFKYHRVSTIYLPFITN